MRENFSTPTVRAMKFFEQKAGWPVRAIGREIADASRGPRPITPPTASIIINRLSRPSGAMV